jgi:hypothetical protein
MAWLVGDGFDTYAGAGELAISPNIWQSVSQCTLIGGSSVRFPPGVALQLGNTSVTAGNASTAQFANSQTIFVNANIISATAHVNGGFTETIGFTLRDTVSNIQCGLFLENGGTFVLVTGAINSGGIVRSPVLMPNSNQWAHIQVKIFIHNTAGTIELRINGSTTANWTASGLNTRNGSANFFANVINWQSSTAAGESVDDFYAFNDQSPAPNTFQGDVHAVHQFPTTDVAISWARNTGPNNCLAVDDGQQDGDATYVATLTPNAADTYGMTALSPTPTAIICVQPRYMARMDDAGPHTMNGQLTSAGTTVNLPTMNVASTYAYASAPYPQDPNTGLAWTPTAVNAILLGIKCLT